MKCTLQIIKASSFAEKAHAGQTRRNGEPYFNHAQRVAELVSEQTEDEALISAAFLHDTMEDCGTTPEELSALFGGRIARLVQELTNDEALLNQLGKEEYMVRKLSAMSSDSLLIKLCDTLNNMSETDRVSQAETYARIQKRLQDSRQANWNTMHRALSDRILAVYASRFGG